MSLKEKDGPKVTETTEEVAEEDREQDLSGQEQYAGPGEEYTSEQAPTLCSEERMQALEQEVAARTREKEEYIQQLQRLQADFDNFRKRVRREQEEAGERVTEELLRELLPVVDNFERAIASAAENGASVESLRTGVVLVYRQLKELLMKVGASPMASQGEVFDPTRHHAVARVESEEYAEGTVVDELQKGYLFHGRVLRPALVRVAARPAQEKVVPLRPEEGET